MAGDICEETPDLVAPIARLITLILHRAQVAIKLVGLSSPFLKYCKILPTETVLDWTSAPIRALLLFDAPSALSRPTVYDAGLVAVQRRNEGDLAW